MHPDRNQISLTTDQKMLEINEAYDTLSDPIKRRAYDIPMGYHTAVPKFKIGSKVRVNARASPFDGFIGVVDQEPIKGGFRFWYMVGHSAIADYYCFLLFSGCSEATAVST